MWYYSYAMRTLIIYESQTGSAQKYAEDIARAVSGDVLPLKKFKAKTLRDYDVIVFGGWVRGGQIQGLDKFLSHYDEMEGKDVIIFSSGMSIPTKQGRLDLISANLLDMYHVRYYELRGNFDYSKLNFLNRMMMDRSLAMIENDPDASIDQKALLSVKDNPIVCYDQERVNRIIEVINGISLERTKAQA